MLKRFTAEGRHECGLDALVAGKRWAFVAVTGERRAAALGVAVQDEAGYHPVPEHWAWADDLGEMQMHAEALNAAEGLDGRTAAQIVASTMRTR